MAVTVNTSGLMSSSGFDVQGLVDQMIQAAQAPEQVWKNQQTTLAAQATALNSLSTKLSSLHTSVESLSDVLGAFAQHTASSSDESLVTASASPSASMGQHSVVVTSLATKAAYYSQTSVASGDTVLSGGSMTVTIGSTTKEIAIGGDTNTLNKIAKKINDLKMGITASVITDATGAKLTLFSDVTGKRNDITVGTTADSALSFKKSSSADNAALSVDGVPITSSTNSVQNVIPGVTLNLNGQNPDRPVAITVGFDPGQVTQAINNFVNSYNALTTAINAQFSYNQDSGSAGVLAGDSAVRTLQQQILQTISGIKVDSSGTPTLGAIGITMNDDGTLAIDSSELSVALASNFSDVQSLFQDPKLGFATKVGTLMNSLTDSVNGPFVVDLKGIRKSQTALTNTIEDFEDRLTIKRQQLVDQLSQVNALLQELPTTENQIDAMLGSIGYNSSSKK